MTSIKFLCAVFFASLCLTSAAAYAKDSNDFTPLFNGKNFDGWYIKLRNADEATTNKVWHAGDGVIHVFKDIPDGFDLNTGKNNTHGMMYTKQKYSKFIFKFEYKWGKKSMNNFAQFQYDAGMYYHVYDDAIWPKGIEYQVRFDNTKNKNHTGDYWASGVQFQWYSADGLTFKAPVNGGKPAPYKSGEHLALLDAPHHALNDQWNQCEVIVMGDKYSIHKLNGKVVNMATHLSVKEGVIGLQSETAEIFYRNIMIKEFDQIVPMEKFLN